MPNDLRHIPVDSMREILLLQERLENLDKQGEVQESFIDYIRYIWPEFIEGDHHKIFAKKLTEIAKGDIKRLIINMPPRHTKSEFASVYFPSWVMGLNPNMKIMQTTHTSELSVRFGRKVRNLMDSEEYKAVFPKSRSVPTRNQPGVGKPTKAASISQRVSVERLQVVARICSLLMIRTPNKTL